MATHCDVEIIDHGATACVCAHSTLAQAWLTLLHGASWHACEWSDVHEIAQRAVAMGFSLRA